MKQLEAIEKIAEVIKKDNAIKAMFLKGSIARNCLDDYSDVDFYCIVDNEGLEDFLNKRIDYLNQYRPIVYWSESNFVGPQIVAVYDNGLHFDLYTVTIETLQNTDEIKVLYDPDDLLLSYKSTPLKLSEEDVIGLFHEFTFSLLEFEAAYCRNDLLWASRLASHLSGNLSMILRYLYDINNSKLGFKRLCKYLDTEMHNKMAKAMDLSGPSNLPNGVMLLVEIAREILEKLPEKVSSNVNIHFFNFMAKKINKLK